MFDDRKILVIDEDLSFCSFTKLLLKRADYDGDSISQSKFALKAIDRFSPSVILLNVNFDIDINEIRKSVPEVILILMTEWSDISSLISGLKKGADTFLCRKKIESCLLPIIRTQLHLAQPTKTELSRMERLDFRNILGNDPQLLHALKTIKNLKGFNANILIEGESGTGKTLLAEAFFYESEEKRHQIPIVDASTLQLSTLTESSSNFLFIKDVDQLSLENQEWFSKYLFEQVLDRQILFTSTINLETAVNNGRFRGDLLHQISMVKLELPPLNKRKEDIPLLANAFLNNLKLLFDLPALKIDDFAIHWLKQQSIEGNISQLKKMISRVALSSFKEKIMVDDFKYDIENCLKDAPIYMPEVGALTWQQVEILMIKQSLEMNEQNEITAAKSLSSTNSGLKQQIKKYNIST